MKRNQFYNIEAIRDEYRRIDDKWLRMQHQLMLWLVVVTAAVETAMFFVLREIGAVSTSLGAYLFKYVLTPLFCNLLLSGLATLAVRGSRLSERRKTYAVSLLMAVMALVIYTVHSVFHALFLIFAIPMILTVVYGDLLLTGLTGLVCILGKAVSDLFVAWDPDRAYVLASKESTADFGLSLLLLLLCCGVCCFLIRIEKEKNGAAIRLEQERQRYQEESVTDELTGVWNRYALREAFRCMEEAGEHTTCFLAMMDLDDFKSLNDTFGHTRGDHYLKTLGGVLKSVSTERVTPFRFGGDEFCVLFTDCTREEVVSVCGEVQQRFGEEEIHQSFRKVTISIGVGRFRPGERPTHLLERADAALYCAKQRRGSVCFEP